MTLCFTLSMPGNNAWDGKWSREGEFFAIVRHLSPSVADPILAKRRFTYSFGDGWVAAVDVKQVEPETVGEILRKSKGFCAYDWMVDSIIDHGVIKTRVTA